MTLILIPMIGYGFCFDSSNKMFHWNFIRTQHILNTVCEILPQNGGTPLLYAVRGNHLKCVEALLSKSIKSICLFKVDL